MHRDGLIKALEKYALSNWYTVEEKETLKSFKNFLIFQKKCFERTLTIGHITASSWLWNWDKTEVLLTYHKKLDRWLQLGGHCDGDSETLRVAIKEAEEESGISGIIPCTEDVFDIDIHFIPQHKETAPHFHYDVRYILSAPKGAVYRISSESKALTWEKPNDLLKKTRESSIHRMKNKACSFNEK